MNDPRDPGHPGTLGGSCSAGAADAIHHPVVIPSPLSADLWLGVEH